MKKPVLFLFTFFTVFTARCQFFGISLNPDVDLKPQIPIASYPFKTGMSYSAKLAINFHVFYLFRFGAGVGFNHSSFPLDTDAFDKPGLEKVKSNWNSLCIPIKIIGCLPIRGYAMPMVEFQSNIMIPQNIYQVEHYGNDKVKNRSPYIRDAVTENIFRMGAIFRDENGRNDLAVNLQLSFTNSSFNRIRFIGVGLNVQYFFVMFRTGIRNDKY